MATVFYFLFVMTWTAPDNRNAPDKLVNLLTALAEKETNPLLKRHFESVAHMTQDTSHGVAYSDEDYEDAAKAIEFFEGDGSKWETYLNGPRPLIFSFQSPSDGKNSFYWFFVPKGFKNPSDQYPLFVELHGSGGGTNDNPRRMLFMALRPEVAGVPNEGYRKEGYYVYPWGRGDKGYRDIAETDIFEVLTDVDKVFATDPARQYLYGFSMGGGGTLKIAAKSPERWAAIATYSGAMFRPSPEDVEKLKDIPIWMAWGENEKRLSESNTELKDKLLHAGATLKWKEIEGVGHQYLGEYQNDMLDWLMLHVKK